MFLIKNRSKDLVFNFFININFAYGFRYTLNQSIYCNKLLVQKNKLESDNEFIYQKIQQ